MPALETCLNKWRLVEAYKGAVRVPVTRLGGPSDGTGVGDAFPGGVPAVAKPRTGSESRGVTVVDNRAGLARLLRDGSYLVQDLLSGTEYSVDALTDPAGRVVAAVPRAHDGTESGVVVVGRVLPKAGRRTGQGASRGTARCPAGPVSPSAAVRAGR
ncbi:ATP-grasp domain-containing protein [Streptomyces sp. NPDC056004]|uniref:ATP-grasp domain-containing protein n=1 Tax=unclassified Streptomyces TaxID=2593676 RepID=UPI0035DB2800